MHLLSIRISFRNRCLALQSWISAIYETIHVRWHMAKFCTPGSFVCTFGSKVRCDYKVLIGALLKHLIINIYNKTQYDDILIVIVVPFSCINALIDCLECNAGE